MNVFVDKIDKLNYSFSKFKNFIFSPCKLQSVQSKTEKKDGSFDKNKYDT